VVNAASGTLSARSSAVHIFDVGAFGGGITNSGKILAGASGALALSNVTSFTGDISNTGTISAVGFGIKMNGGSVFTGVVSNSGKIVANGNDGVDITDVSTFAGNVINSGTVSGATGIHVSGVALFTGPGRWRRHRQQRQDLRQHGCQY